MLKERNKNYNQSLLYQPVSLFQKIPALISGFGTRALTRPKLQSLFISGNLKLVFLKQVHSDNFQFIDSSPDQILAGDALITKSSGMLLCVQTADCLPVLIVEPKTHTVAAVHCGWRGTARGFLLKVVNFMLDDLHCHREDLLFAFGPRICGNCYEVGQDVRNSFAKHGLSLSGFASSSQNGERWKLDLLEANLAQIKEVGVNFTQVEIVDQCTSHHPGWWSYRRDRERAGRLFNFIGWRKKKEPD